MYISPRLRGGNRFAGGSLVTFAAIFVHLQAEWEGDDFVFASFNNFTPCIFGCAGGNDLPAGLSRRLRRFDSPPSGMGGWGVWFGVFSTILHHVCSSPAARGGNRSSGGSLETFAAILVRLQAEWEGSEFVLASFNQLTPRIFLAGCAGGTSLPATL